MSEERKLTPEENAKQLREVIDGLELSLEENKVMLLNIYSVLVKELRMEVVELAEQLKRDPKDLFSRKTIYEHLQQVEVCENNVFQLSNSVRHNSKKLEAVTRYSPHQ